MLTIVPLWLRIVIAVSLLAGGLVLHMTLVALAGAVLLVINGGQGLYRRRAAAAAQRASEDRR
jgi:hypothetical protein